MFTASFKKTLLIRIGVSALLIFALAVFIIILNININKRVRVIEQEKNDLAARNETINSLSDLQQEYEKAKPLFSQLTTALPTRDELINFPKELDAIAKRDKVDVGFSFGNEQPGTATESGFIKFTLSLAGSFQNILAFLTDLEAHPYFIHIPSLDLTRRDKNTYALVTTGEIFTQ